MKNRICFCGATLFLALGQPMTVTAQPNGAHTSGQPASQQPDPYWRNATIYFLMTDRFANGDPSNDQSVNRKHDGGPLRSFEGGDLKGVTQKIEEGYFDALGVDAIWTTPVIENVHGSVDEGEWGRTYAYHGYWPKDWTKVDSNFGTEADFVAMVRAAHARNIRVIVDVIINHAGAPTKVDPVWPESWVRRGPPCQHKRYQSAVTCELSFTLQDIKTESEVPVELPDFLIAKWRAEGRLKQEQRELDAFFKRTGYPRAPKYYIVKWLTDWVRDYGVDGFRVDTAKHVDPEIWGVVKKEAAIALADWRSRNPERMKGDHPFYMVGEVFNYGLDGFSNAVDGTRLYDYGDRQVDFYNNGFDALINMGFPTYAKLSSRSLFAINASELENGAFKGVGTLNYISSHDDMGPFDPDRTRTFESATKLMLSPGAAQIYYGDEVGRDLTIEGTKGDATLRSSIEWAGAKNSDSVSLLAHWRKLGQFRKAHPAVGAGLHRELSKLPFVFSRTLNEGGVSDRVVIALDMKPGLGSIPVGSVFQDGATVLDYYSGQSVTVAGGSVRLAVDAPVVLLSLKE